MWINLWAVRQVPIDEIAPMGTEFALWAAVDRPSGFPEPLMLIDFSLQFDGCIDDAVVTGLRGCLLAELIDMQLRTSFAVVSDRIELLQTWEVPVDMEMRIIQLWTIQLWTIQLRTIRYWEI